MKSRKLFTVAKKIELKLALAQELSETLVEGTPPEKPKAIYYSQKPAGWNSAKVLELQKMIAAWGRKKGINLKLIKEDGIWGDETSQIVYGLQQNEDFEGHDISNPDAMYNYFKSQSLLEKVPPTFGLNDANMQSADPKFVAKVQERLKSMDRYKGPTDGKWNAEAGAALAKLQKEKGNSSLNSDVVLDNDTKTALGL